MRLESGTPSDEEIRDLFEGYREAGEPDSGTVPFDSLGEAEKVSIRNLFRRHHLALRSNDRLIGFLTVTTMKDPRSLNVGAFLFSEFRGRGLATPAFQHLLEKLRVSHPGFTVFASTRVDNLPARRAMVGCGFVEDGMEIRPPLGSWKTEIQYVRFRLPGVL